MRLIDADALKHEIAKVMPSRTEVSLIVDGMPDAIVRCKDCIYGHQLFADYVSCEISEENEAGCHVSHKPDWFCADGVKKNEIT